MLIVGKMRTYDQDFYDVLRAHPAMTGSSDGTADPDEEMGGLFYESFFDNQS